MFAWTMGGGASTGAAEFEPLPALEDGENEIRLSVYSLPALGWAGGYHSGLVLRGSDGVSVEFGFAGGVGVYQCEAECDPAYEGRLVKRVMLGVVPTPWAEVVGTVATASEQWPGLRYHTTSCNCNDFAAHMVMLSLPVVPEPPHP